MPHSPLNKLMSVLQPFISYINLTNKSIYTEAPGLKDLLIMHPEHGKSINIFNASKYLDRYMAPGHHIKSSNPEDLYKAMHYILFELKRLEMTQAVQSKLNPTEPIPQTTNQENQNDRRTPESISKQLRGFIKSQQPEGVTYR